MTVTEDAPAAVTAPSEPTATPATTGLAATIGSGDHKVVGRLWLVAAMAHLLLVGIAAALVAVEKVDLSGLDVVGSDWFGEYFAFRSIGGAFLVLLPLTIGLATTIVPLQLGASTLAFPRAAAAAAWTYLVGGGLVVGSFAIDGGPFGADVDGQRLFLTAFALVLLAEVVAWITIATTVITMRVPGLSLARTPLYAWSMLVAGAVWIIVLPVLAAMVVITYLDVRYGGQDGFFGGGQQAIYPRISWAFSTPTVYAFGIPVLGVIGSFVPVFSRTRHQQHRVAQGLIGAFGVLSVGAWTVPGFAGDDRYQWLYELPWIAVSIAAVLPVVALLGLWALTARKGRPELASPMLFGLASGLMLLVGVLAGAVQAIEPIKTLVDGDGTSLYGTTWSTSVASYVVLASVIALLGGLVYWAPKLIGRTVADGAARGVAVALLFGTVLWSFPELVAGLLGQPASLGDPADNVSTIEGLNIASAIGAVVLGLAVVGFVALYVRALGSDELPGDDPWNGHTLEWATSSPPPFGNFASLPEVTSEAPLYDARHRTEEASA
jgi:heme/copper-type cytochrome/quinol oxidase subunit 1